MQRRCFHGFLIPLSRFLSYILHELTFACLGSMLAELGLETRRRYIAADIKSYRACFCLWIRSFDGRRFLCGGAIRTSDSGGDAGTSSNKSTSGLCVELDKLNMSMCSSLQFQFRRNHTLWAKLCEKLSFDECFGVWYCKSYVQKELTWSGSLSVSPVSTVSGSLGRKPRNLVHTHVLICALKDQHYGHICEEINFWSIAQQPGGLWNVILCIHFWLELYASP